MSHPAGTFMVPAVTAQIPMMTSAECAATVIGAPEGHGIMGFLGGTGGHSFVGGA